MADGECFWIFNTGAILQVSDFHILAVIRNPKIFHETPESIQETFTKNQERVQSNFEGKSREEILRRIIKNNFIRIRKYKLKKCQHWSIQLQSLNEQRSIWITMWAKYISAHTPDKYADVIIHELSNDNKITTSLNKLAIHRCVSEKDDLELMVLTESQLSDLYNK